MKRILMALTVVLTLAVGAIDTGLLEYVPAKSELTFLVDVDKLLKLPAAKSVLEDEEVSGAAAELAKAGVGFSDIKAAMGFAHENDGGVVLKICNGNKIKELLDSSPNQNGLTIEAMQVNGRRIYRFIAKGRGEKPVCTFIADDLILWADGVKNLERFIAAPKLSAAETGKFASGIPSGIAFWGAWRNPEPAPKQGDKAADRVEAVTATLDFTGKELRDIDVTADILCGSGNFASMLGMMIPGYVSIGSGVVFSDAPELGEELMKGFKSRIDGKMLKLRLHISEKLVRHITEFSTRMAKEQVAPVAQDGKAPGAVPAK